MSNKINILYFKLRKTEDSLLNQIMFHSDVQLHIIENENINILMFLKNNREYFIEKYSLIFIDLDYLADNVNNRNQFVLSRWNNNLDDLIREKIVVLNYNNFLDGHNLAKIKIKAFYQKEALLEFLDNEKLLKEKVFLPHEQTSVIEDEFCIFKNPDKEDSQKEDLKDDEQENKHNAESTGNLEGEENTETSKTVESEDKQEIDQEQEKVQEQEDLTAEEEEQEDSTEQEQKVESEEKQSDEQPQDSKEKLPNQTQEKTPEDLFQNEAFNTQTDTTIESNDEQEDEEDEGDSVDRKDLRQFKEKTKKLLSSQVGNLLKKRVKEKEPKKEKREKREKKQTLPEVKVKKDIDKIFPENLPSRYIINVFGTKEKIGITYTSLYLALKAKEEGYSSCLIVEDNDYKILSSSTQYSAIYKASQKREANQHDIIINDIGVYDVNDSEFFEKFYMGNMSVLVVAINYPNTFSQHNIRRYLENENDYPNIIALNFSDEDEFKQFEKEYKRHTKVIQIPFKALD